MLERFAQAAADQLACITAHVRQGPSSGGIAGEALLKGTADRLTDGSSHLPLPTGHAFDKATAKAISRGLAQLAGFLGGAGNAQRFLERLDQRLAGFGAGIHHSG